MSEDLLNVMGSFSETALDCIEKQNEEIEQLQQENSQLKIRIEKAIEYIKENDNSELGIYQTKFIGKDKLIKILKGE